MATIELIGVEKSYGETPVVRGLDLSIADGEFVVLVGPSGCGKSTTLRMIAGLESITKGTLKIDGVVVNEVKPGDRDLAMVFQSYALYPHMSVRENIGFGLRVRKTGSEEMERATRDVAEMLGLEELLDRRPAELSGGQRQRVAMARAIVRAPKAFLFDEPLSNLDAKLRTEVRAEIARLRRRMGTTTVYVTHDQVEAMTLADRVVVLHEGVAQQIGTPLDVYERPANRFVAAFLGTPTINLLDGEAGESGFAPRSPGLLRFDAPAQTRAVGVRPHDVTAGPPDGDLQGTNLGRITVDVVERLGPETFVYGNAGETRLAARLPADQHAAAGEEVSLAADPTKLLFFDDDDLRIPA